MVANRIITESRRSPPTTWYAFTDNQRDALHISYPVAPSYSALHPRWRNLCAKSLKNIQKSPLTHLLHRFILYLVVEAE